MNRQNLYLSAIIGLLLGGAVSKVLFVGSFLNLILWGAVGVYLGYRSETQKSATINGAVYGFFLSFVFMLVGYQGAAPIISRIPFFIVLGIFGGVCGLASSTCGYFGRKLKKR